MEGVAPIRADEEGTLGVELARGAGWVLPGQVAAELRGTAPWRGVHRALLPGALLFLCASLVGAYFGVPSALLNLMVCACTVGHLWPRWSAHAIEAAWTPQERFLRVEIHAQGLVVSSGAFRACLPRGVLRGRRRTPGGWLIDNVGRAPLWIARSALGERGSEELERLLEESPQARTRALLWVYVGASGVSVVGTVLWYLAALP